MGIGSLASTRAGPLAKRLDWYLGIPLVALLGMLRRKRSRPDTIRRVGLLKTAGIGDAVLLTGPVQDLKRAFPGVELYLFLGDHNVQVAPLIPEGVTVVELPVKKPIACARILRRFAIDLFLDFGPWPRINALYSLLARARYRVGFATEGQYRHYAYDLAVPHSFDVHELENYRTVLRAVGVTPGQLPELSLPAGARAAISNAQLNRSIIFHPWPAGAARLQRMWPQARWVELGCMLRDQGFEIVLTGGASDRKASMDLVSLLCRQECRARSYAGALSLPETAAVLWRARAVVSVDTGIMHIASALGARVVALHGPSSPKRWGGTGPATIAVNATVPGSGYLNLGFEVPDDPPPCMESISAAAVHAALVELLARDDVAPDTRRQSRLPLPRGAGRG
ncbi:MAG: glycosyltransferase family 9 protein [Rhodospirillales bacterium]